LRHPTLARQLRIESSAGLAELLMGAITIDEASRPLDLEVASASGVRGRALEVLLAGAVLPRNPAELLESDSMAALLEWARFSHDLVVIDAPPLTTVSDAFPLLSKVDGVLVVGRPGRSRRDAAERLLQVLAGSGVPLLGVIANGVKPDRHGSYPAAPPDSPLGAPANRVALPQELVSTTNV
jgi:Mrp family chromosome partitioning ATPase